ncbi:MAG TPA: asparagine synthase C-terminal domain-containing protein, partial [Cytophagales bacterium]|nr:asparagine synthase C-terminal domain-containing protein [Cytophagales bacterium]
IMISNQTLLDCVLEVLDYIDEPFADASALALYVLSKETKKHVTVALSGDGADEIFGGYNKYAGLQTIQQLPSICRSKSVLIFDGLLKGVPTSRTGPFSNGIRQLRKLLQGMALEPHERYLKFSAINTSKEVSEMFNEKFMLNFDYDSVKELEYSWSVKDEPIHDINDILWRDQSMVLPNDMLVKVDLMAMANSLEVRCPFLDHTIGSFVNRLPARYKLDGKRKKKMLQDAYRKDLPEALYNRPKKGFDVPLIPWFQKELHSFVFNELLERSFVERQGIFDYSMITRLKDKLFAQNKGEVQAQLWSLVVFQYWYKKRFT